MAKWRRYQVSLGFAVMAVCLGLCSVTAQTGHSAHTAKDFAGTWHLLFQGTPFATLILDRKGDQLTGSMTNEHIHTDENGKIDIAEPVAGSTPIARTAMESGALHIVEKDGDDETEWAMTLTSATTAELRPAGEGAPTNVGPIQLEKVQ